jgi:ring-1,2-phenylacetyl-CoA epoxidase subunit PaaD
MNKLYDIVNQVKDPEIPTISVVELGVVRGIEQIDNKVVVTITPTYSGCPALDVMRSDIIKELNNYGYSDVEVKTILSPAWTTDWLTESAKQKLIESKIAPPASSANEYSNLLNVIDDGPAIQCPYCNSYKTKLIAEFGTTACKALYNCMDCMQPFDYFKPH